MLFVSGHDNCDYGVGGGLLRRYELLMTEFHRCRIAWVGACGVRAMPLQKFLPRGIDFFIRSRHLYPNGFRPLWRWCLGKG
jgi:hypothetical protein